uniref:Sedoheptulokinase n=1 Tax=Mus musculus TaxID=10090 RepID=D6RJM2_MOUSE
MASRPVTLGIDLGTTSVKAALLEAAPSLPSGFVVLASCARAARAETESAVAGPQGREQDVTRIIQALNECLDALPRQQLQRVRGIGVSGQMHGILFWKAGQATSLEVLLKISRSQPAAFLFGVCFWEGRSVLTAADSC